MKCDFLDIPHLLKNHFILFTYLLFATSNVFSDTQEIVHCRKGYFKCPMTDKCIPNTKLHDKINDCPDKSDEIICKSDEYQCKSMKCVPRHKLCDREQDCPDGEDEDPDICFAQKCKKEEFLCSVLLDKCVYAPCSRESQCLDFTDISRPEISCKTEEFQCKNRKSCIQKSKLCDGSNDCSDGSDEADCQSKPKPLKPHEIVGYFYCHDGIRVIPKEQLCNGNNDCDKGEDEMGCQKSRSHNRICGPHKFACKETVGAAICILREKLCDGHSDCTDHSDELNPECRDDCEASQFACRSRDKTKKPFCIDRSKLCDGFQHCPEGDDEAFSPRSNCTVASCTVNNGGCNHLCEQTFNKIFCRCFSGFVLQQDGKTCLPMGLPTLVFVSEGTIQEKQLSRVHQSVLTFEEAENSAAAAKAFWKVSEARGSKISEDRLFTDLWTNISCVNFAYRTQTSSQTVAELHNIDRPARLGDSRMILFWSLRNSQFPGIFMGANSHDSAMLQIEPLAVAPDLFAESSEATEKAAKALQSTLPQVVAAPVSAAEIAIDWVHGLLYWLCSDCDSIAVLSLEQRWRKTLIDGVKLTSSALALDPRLALIYFMTRRNHSYAITVAGSDGTLLGHLIESDSLHENSHISIDLLDNELLWNEPQRGKIWAIDLKTNVTRLLFHNPDYRPSLIDVFAHSVYFYDELQSAIFRIDKRSGDLDMVHKARGVTSLKILHDIARPAWLNRCYANPCSHLCLPSPMLDYPPRRPSFICACADGWLLNEDGETCRPSNHVLKKAMLFLADSISALFSNPGSMDAFKETLFGSSRVDAEEYWRFRAMKAKLYESQGDPWLTAILVLFLITATALITTVMACGLHLGSKRHINSNFVYQVSLEKLIPLKFDLGDENEDSNSIYHSAESLTQPSEKV